MSTTTPFTSGPNNTPRLITVLLLSISWILTAASTSDSSTGGMPQSDPVAIHLSRVKYDNGKNLTYYHCGPSSASSELVLLRSKTSTKETWKKSGILDDLCDGTLSVKALDLPSSADGAQLMSAFDALVKSNSLSGEPVVICTPGESGSSVLDLANNSSDLGKVVKAWIHVASPSIRKVSDSVLQSFVTRNISVLSIHGDQDEMGRRGTEKLVNTVNAKGVELQGGHRVYLFSPQDFVQEIYDFLGFESEVKNPSKSPVTNPAQVPTSLSSSLSNNTKPANDAMAINLSQVTYDSGRILSYYHCGPTIDSVTTELVLLHGSTGTKEDFKSKGILDDLCDGSLSVTALDFPPGADGTKLLSAFDALVKSSTLSGRPVIIVTPSASGASVVSLAENNTNGLRRMVKAWIPVASPSVLSASDAALQAFPGLNIPVLAINGDDDGMGRRVTEKLVNDINAKGVELTGGHRVYLFSPIEFVQEIVDFIEEESL
ncbi:hypothetical protein HJC23_011961 [Cyclotella cryptica]|uniref:AB hydrolase-1 domain-containing protein n=1 Tax=Cyclotella cryptica TaxID=29204 RepID=A0ABD3QQW4_9STRA|eukprot:CCRYP_003025-RA/>CCRYP_003025-RA protein AED:0.06 eAED:0.01 QI:0/-1/0/1/-1/1/1/0/487